MIRSECHAKLGRVAEFKFPCHFLLLHVQPRMAVLSQQRDFAFPVEAADTTVTVTEQKPGGRRKGWPSEQFWRASTQSFGQEIQQ